MTSGPFVWRPGYFSSESRVELLDDAIIIETKGDRRRINFSDVSGVYLPKSLMFPISHFLHVEIVTKNGDDTLFSVSRWGIPGSAAEECKRAALALLSRLNFANAATEIFQGVRPTLQYKATIAGTLLAAYLYVAYVVWSDGDVGDWRFMLIVLVSLFAIMAGLFFIQFQDSAIARSISLDDAIAYLD